MNQVIFTVETAGMKSYFGVYTSPGHNPVDCTVLVFDKNLSIGYKSDDESNRSVNWMLREVLVNFELARQSTVLRHSKLPGELMIEGRAAADFVGSMQKEMQKPWHQKSSGKEWIRNSLLFLGIAGILVLLYLLIVPWLSEKLAAKVPVKTEMQLGNAVYDAMGMQAQEDTAASRLLNEFFREMEIPTAYDIRISVVNDNVVNAFALPGGRIVVYKALLQQINSYPELAALLSHEFTHIQNKHSTKSIFRRFGSKVFLGLLFGSFGSVTSVLVNNADNLKQLTYSRKLEKEADTEGLEILVQRKIDPRGFVDLFTHLGESAPGSVIPEFLASHPDIEKRIGYIKEASKNAAVAEDVQLKAIFDQLK